MHRIKRLSKRRKVVSGLVAALVLVAIAFVIWGVASGFFRSLAAGTPISNTATVSYQDLSGNSYSAQSNTVLTDVADNTSGSAGTTGTTGTSGTTGSSAKKSTAKKSTGANPPASSSAAPSSNQLVSAYNRTTAAVQSNTLKPWAFWFLFGFIPLFLIITAIYYFFRLRHK